MNFLLDISALLLFGVIVFQDFKYRAIHWILIPFLALLFIIKGLQNYSSGDFILHFALNCVIILIILLLTGGYYFLKNKTFNFFDKALGWGDVLLFFVLALAFEPEIFILLLNASFILVLVCTFIYLLFTKNKKRPTIPLAGGISIVMIFYLSGSYFFPPGNPVIQLFNSIIS